HNWFILVVLVADNAQGSRAQVKEAPTSRLKSAPACGQHAKKMAAGEDQSVTLQRSQPGDHEVSPRPDVCQAFPTGTTIAEKLPIGSQPEDVRCGFSLVSPIVPFNKVRIDFCQCAETGQLARAPGPLQWAREHMGEGQPPQPPAKTTGIAFPTLGQRDVGQTGVLPGDRPRSLAVTCQINCRKRLAH